MNKIDPLRDGHNRRIRDVRVSVTDRCNFRCQYCMPAEGLTWLERDAVLSFEELERLVTVLATMGVHDIRLTGGEPLVRRDFPRLAAMLGAVPGVQDLSVTTNGFLLERDAEALVAAERKCGWSKKGRKSLTKIKDKGKRQVRGQIPKKEKNY